jgi:hypothetical protein
MGLLVFFDVVALLILVWIVRSQHTVLAFIGVLFSLAVIAFCTFVILIGTTWRPWSVTKSVKPVAGEYYQVTADYTYMGKPVKLRFGYKCHGQVTTYKDGDKSHDIFGGPNIYGVKLPDGKALIIGTFYFCESIRPNAPNAGMPDDLQPITLLYEDYDTLADGYMFASDEAYNRPNSELKFEKIRFASFSSEDFVALLKTQIPNVVRNPSSAGILGVDQAARDKLYPGKRRPIATDCVGWKKLKLRDEIRDEVRKHRPANKPHYWRPPYGPSRLLGPDYPNNQRTVPTDAVAQALQAAIHADKSGAARYGDLGVGTAGIPRVDGSGLMRSAPTHKAVPFYPVELVSKNEWLPAEKRWQPPVFVRNIETEGDAKRGLLRCQSGPKPLDPVIERTRKLEESLPTKWFIDLEAQHFRFTVDDIEVVNFTGPPGGFLSYFESEFFFENDEYIFESEALHLDLVYGEQLDDNKR